MSYCRRLTSSPLTRLSRGVQPWRPWAKNSIFPISLPLSTKSLPSKREYSSKPLLQLTSKLGARYLSHTTSSRDPTPPSAPPPKPTIRENIYTIPNFLTTTRIFACPILGWAIVSGDFHLASGLVVYAGLTDLVSGLRTHTL